MRLPRRLILRIANELFSYKNRVTQKEVQEKITKALNRSLTSNEKRRITMILRREFVVAKIDIDMKTKERILYFC